MKIIILLIFITLILFSDLKSQSFETKSSYISLNLGGYKTSLGQKISNRSTSSLTVGTGFGYALSINSFIYSKLTYFSMPKFLAYQNNPDYSIMNNASNLKEIRASFKQYIFDLGFQQNYKISSEWLCGAAGGPSFILFNLETRNLDGTLIQNIKNNRLFGYFGGINVEKKFREDAVTMFGEIQYNHSFTKTEYQKAFNGINYTVGLKFYLSRSEY